MSMVFMVCESWAHVVAEISAHYDPHIAGQARQSARVVWECGDKPAPRRLVVKAVSVSGHGVLLVVSVGVVRVFVNLSWSIARLTWRGGLAFIYGERHCCAWQQWWT